MGEASTSASSKRLCLGVPSASQGDAACLEDGVGSEGSEFSSESSVYDYAESECSQDTKLSNFLKEKCRKGGKPQPLHLELTRCCSICTGAVTLYCCSEDRNGCRCDYSLCQTCFFKLGAEGQGDHDAAPTCKADEQQGRPPASLFERVVANLKMSDRQKKEYPMECLCGSDELKTLEAALACSSNTMHLAPTGVSPFERLCFNNSATPALLQQLLHVASSVTERQAVTALQLLLLNPAVTVDPAVTAEVLSAFLAKFPALPRRPPSPLRCVCESSAVTPELIGILRRHFPEPDWPAFTTLLSNHAVSPEVVQPFLEDPPEHYSHAVLALRRLCQNKAVTPDLLQALLQSFERHFTFQNGMLDLWPALLDLCQNEAVSCQLIEVLLGRVKDAVRAFNGAGDGPLHVLCRSTALTPELIQLLLRYDFRGHDVWKSNSYGECPLHVVCRNAALTVELPKLLKCLLQHSRDSAECVSKHGALPFHVLCSNATLTLETFRVLLWHFPAAARHADNSGMFPLHLVCKQPAVTLEMIKDLLRCFPHAARHEDIRGFLPIHFLCQNRAVSPEMLKILLGAASQPHCSACHSSCDCKMAVLLFLYKEDILRGDTPKPLNEAQPPLVYLCSNEAVTGKLIETFLASCARCRYAASQADGQGQLPLHHLCCNRNVSPECLSALLRHCPAAVQTADLSGNTPFQYLFRNQHASQEARAAYLAHCPRETRATMLLELPPSAPGHAEEPSAVRRSGPYGSSGWGPVSQTAAQPLGLQAPAGLHTCDSQDQEAAPSHDGSMGSEVDPSLEAGGAVRLANPVEEPLQSLSMSDVEQSCGGAGAAEDSTTASVSGGGPKPLADVNTSEFWTSLVGASAAVGGAGAAATESTDGTGSAFRAEQQDGDL